MPDDSTKLIISVETLLKGLDRTLKGLDAIDRKLKSLGQGQSTGASQTQRTIERNQQARQRTERSIEQENIRNFDRRIKAIDSAEKRRTAVAQRETRVRQALERADEQQNIRSFQRRIGAIDRVERQRTSTVERETRNRARIERTAEQVNLRGFQRRIAAIDRAERSRVKQAVIQERALPQVDSHVQVFRRAQDAAKQYNAELVKVGNAARSAGQGLISLGFILSAAISAPLIALAKSSVEASITLDSLKRGLTAIVGSAAQANTQLTRLTEIAKLPGIGFQEAIQGSIRLQAVGFSAREAERALVQFSNAVALTGGGRDELARITVQLGQLAAKGKVLSQDLRPIIEAAPAVGKALKAAFGTVNADDIAELSGSSEEFLKILVAELERLPRAAAGAKNSFENFRDEVFRASTAIGDALLPALTLLVQVAGPVITKLAEGFRALPVAVQGFILFIGLLTAALGPLLIGAGILLLSFGRLSVAIGQFGTQNLAATFSMRALTVSMAQFNVAATATIARLTGLRAATIAAAGPWAALAAAIGVVALVAFSKAQREIVDVDIEAAKVARERAKALEEEVKFLESLAGNTKVSAEENKKLQKSYESLSGAEQFRIGQMEREEERLKALLEAKKEQLRIDQFAAQATSAQLVNNVTLAINKQTEAQQGLTQAKKDFDQLEQLAKGGKQTILIGGRVVDVLTEQKEVALEGAEALKRIGDTKSEINKAAGAIIGMSKATGISTEAILSQAKAAGVNEDAINKVRQAVAEFTEEEKKATVAVDNLTKALREQEKEDEKFGKDADEAQKRRRALISNNAALAREAAKDFEGALKFMRAFIAARPDLKAAIIREAEIEGKTFEEVLRESLGGGRKGAERLSRSLADAEVDLTKAKLEKQVALTKSTDDELARLNDERFRQELISFNEFIRERERLENREIGKEIERQQQIIKLAEETIEKERLAGQKARTPAGRERAQAEERQAQTEQVKAETKILELQSRQKDVTAEADAQLEEFNKRRLLELDELKREIDELVGRSRKAGEAAIEARFAELLRQIDNELTRVQDLADQVRQSQIDRPQDIELHTRQLALAEAARERAEAQKKQVEGAKEILKAEVAVRDAQEQIHRALEQQSLLEKQIVFDVEFRGQSEEEALRRRLAGEKLVQAEIVKQQAEIQKVIDKLKTAGQEIPTALIDGLKQLEVAAKGLGEVGFTEQFQIAEKEFNRIQDELADKISDVERRIRSRDIAEVQGAIVIRRLNGEKIDALEAQLALLEAIAAESNDESLRRQAAAARQTTKDIRAAAEETENFDRQLKSVAIDSFNDSLSQLFKDLRDNTENAAQDILNFFNNILNRVNDFIGEQLAREITESLFPKGEGAGGLLDAIKKFFDFGGKKAPVIPTVVGGPIPLPAGDVLPSVGATAEATAAGAALTTGATAAATALTTGGTAAGAALSTGGATAATALATSITAAGATFAATVAAAGAAFAAAVAASSIAQGASAGLGNIGAFAAAGDIFTAKPAGRVIRVAEGGHDEAVLTTDPRFALRQANILREFLKRTKGLFGQFHAPEFAAGGFISRQDAEAHLLSSINRRSASANVPRGSLPQIDSSSTTNLRILNLLDRRQLVGGHMRSAEGAQDIMNVISENAPEIGRRLGVK